MTFQVTSLYAAILAVGVIILANVVSAQRARAGVSILHGDDMRLALWMRRHGNLVENAALVLLLMALAEAREMPASWLHGAGIVLVLARVVHAVGLDERRPAAPLRIAGGLGTQLVTLGLAGYLLWSLYH